MGNYCLNEKDSGPYFTGVWGRFMLMKIQQTRGNFSNKTCDYDRISLILLIENAVGHSAQLETQQIFGRKADAKSKRNADEAGGNQHRRY
jgi:hypothetical protein